MYTISKRVLCLGTASLLAMAAPAFAQSAPAEGADAANTGLDDIVVTARKRTETLIEAPVAVTAIGAADLVRYNASDLSRISQLAPQLAIIRSPSGAGATFNIRGIGSSPLEPGLDQSVSVNLDGIQLGRGRFISLGMFDLQQVEVLKGPQALFFGKNSPAGVVSLTTMGPTDRLEASLTAGYEFRANERYAEGAISGPLTETLGARLAFRYSAMDGYIRNLARPVADPFKPGLVTPGALTRRLPEGKNIAGRLTLAFKPDSAFSATAKLSLGREKNKSMIGNQENFCLPGVTSGQAGVPDPYTECGYNFAFANSAYNPELSVRYPGANGGKPYSDTDILLTSLNMNYDMGDLSLASVTGYGSLVFHGFDNFSFSSFPEIVANNNESTKTFSQEFRLSSDYDGPFNFMVGAYYERVRRHDYARPTLFYFGDDTRNGAQYSYQRDAYNRNHALSGFAQLRWNIVEDVELAGGARWTKEVKKLRIGNTFVNNQYTSPLQPEGLFISGKYKDTDWSPEATLSWHPAPNSTLYVAYKTGYKSGGFTNPLIFQPAASTNDIAFTPEDAKGGEIGYKAKLFDNTVRFEIDAYYYTFNGLQLSSYVAATNSYYVKNAGRARTKGIETNIEWKASPELLVRASAGYNHARYLSFPTAQCYQTQTVAQGCFINAQGAFVQDLKGRRLTRAPDLVASFGASYDTALTAGLMLGLDADLRYSSKYDVDEALTPFIRQGGYTLINGSVRLYPESERWQVSLIGRNLTNRKYHNFAQDQPAAAGAFAVQVERPREVALQVKFSY